MSSFSPAKTAPRTVTVQNEAQAQAMQQLCDSAGRPIETNRDPHLNSRTDTILIPHNIRLGPSFEDCAPNIKENLKAQDLPILSVQCYTIPPRNQRTQAARIARVSFD